MPWATAPDQGDRWHCEVCDGYVEGVGPWCRLYCEERRTLCRPLAHKWLEEADAAGDGPMVNALCEAGRRLWGACLHW